MHRLIPIVYWQLAFFVIAGLVLGMFGFGGSVITGWGIASSENTDPFAPPFDAFTSDLAIVLQHDKVDNTTFHITADISMADSYVYHKVYYYTTSGWQSVTLGGEPWIKNSVTTHIEDFYAVIPDRPGEDDFFIGVWTCKSVNQEWKCGCADSNDCNKWHLQSIELDYEGGTLQTCVDSDTDGYGVSGLETCTYSTLDCDDTNSAVNPGASESTYNGVDDDCDPLTRDDDLDSDGFIQANDCDDTDALISPNGIEICEDSIDQDCDSSDKVCEQCGEGGIPSTGCSCSGTSYWTGFCCDNNYQGLPCGSPEVIFYDGFESGTANTWQYLNPYADVNTDVPQAGSYSLNLRYASGGLTENQYAETPLVSDTRLFHRYFMYFEEDFTQPVNGVSLSGLGNSNWVVGGLVRQWQGQSTQGRLSVVIDSTEYTTSSTLNNGQWYCVEHEVDVSSGVVRTFVDGAQVDEQTGLSLSGSIDYLRQGGLYSDGLGATPIHVYVDNVVVSRQQVGCS